MWPNPQEIADLVTFTEEILNGKLIFVQWKCTILDVCRSPGYNSKELFLVLSSYLIRSKQILAQSQQ